MGDLYAAPQDVRDPDACDWYHAMDLPELGTVGGSWDLRPTIDAYLGDHDFTGQRCLDVGTSSGYLTFEMERRGAAEVVSLDMDPTTDEWEVVPYGPPFDPLAEINRMRGLMLARQRAYWLAHRLLGSRARVHYGNAYRIPEALGRFDVALVGMMLPHVRDPFRVLEQVAARVSETIIVTQQAPQEDRAYAYFMPDPDTRQPPNAWWSMSESCTERMLGVLGFGLVRAVRAEHACPARGDTESCSALVFRRHDAP